MKQAMKITDHALLRYMERVKGIDTEGFRQYLEDALNKPRLRQVVDFAGDTNFKVKTGGITYCIRGGHVTTCYLE